MRVVFLSIGETQEAYLKQGMAIYESRLKHYCSFSRKELHSLKLQSSLSQAQIREQEGLALLKCIGPKDEVILLDERGVQSSSSDWAAQIEQKMVRGVSSMVFVVGGAYGFSEAMYARANELRSLSSLTFSHQMVRLIFLEQLYRCFSIIRKEPYHHVSA